MEEALKFTAYVGTYTDGESKGIYKFILDVNTGTVINAELAAEIGNPTYLAVNRNNSRLYSVAKIDDNGGAAAFSIDSEGKLQLINYMVSEGKPPCHVSLDDKNNYLFSANYHKGTVEVFPIGEDGSISAAAAFITHEGTAHVHYTALTPDQRYLCAIDLGTDKLVLYNFCEGILTSSQKPSVSFKDGCGPRHMAFHPNGLFAYVITELSSEVAVFEYCEENCSFKEIQYISTLPEDYHGENSGSAINFSNDGSYLYVSNRGRDSIAIFKVNRTSGKLEFRKDVPAGGKYPRDFAIDPSGSFMAVANQHSDNIVLFQIDKITGELKQASETIYIPSPVCIKFLQ